MSKGLKTRQRLWAIFYQGKITLPIFLTKQTALADLYRRPEQYHTNKKDYALVRYEAKP